jgi:hypothetical protein
MNDGPQREMTLDEWMDTLPFGHRARVEYAALLVTKKDYLTLVDFCHAEVKRCAERIAQSQSQIDHMNKLTDRST